MRSRESISGWRTPSGVPPGWCAANGLLEPDRTLAGYQARLQEVKASCTTRDCRRRLHVDVAALVARGLGPLRVADLQRLYRCNRLDGCSLTFHEDKKQSSLPLRVLCGHSWVRIRIACTAAGCRVVRTPTPDALIARLEKEGTGGEATLVCDIAGLIRGKCRCGKRSWRVDIVWPDPNAWGSR